MVGRFSEEFDVTGDLVIIAQSKEELRDHKREWKKKMESKGLSLNMPMTKIIVS